MKDTREGILQELESGDSLREVWARTMKNRMSSNEQFKLPDAKCMSAQQISTATGGSERTKFCRPSLIVA